MSAREGRRRVQRRGAVAVGVSKERQEGEEQRPGAEWLVAQPCQALGTNNLKEHADGN